MSVDKAIDPVVDEAHARVLFLREFEHAGLDLEARGERLHRVGDVAAFASLHDDAHDRSMAAT